MENLLLRSPSPEFDVFAMLEPKSTDAEETVSLRHNARFLLRQLQFHCSQQDHTPSHVIRLEFSSFFGRSCLSIGSSQSNEIMIPSGSDVAACQFILRFHWPTGILLLQDTSESGTKVSGEHDRGSRILMRMVYPIMETTRISFGARYRFKFRLVLMDCFRDVHKLQDFFCIYAESMARPKPLLLDRIQQIKVPLEVLGPDFLHLHQRHAGQTGTCIRLRDGNVFALRSVPNGTTELQRVEQCSSIRIRHVSYQWD
jgi:hypothetical protein